MYKIQFFKQGKSILIIEIPDKLSNNKPRVISGDDRWFDYSIAPYSTKLGRNTTLKENPEQWAKELATLYNKSDNDITVRVTKVTYTDKNNLPLPGSYITNNSLPMPPENQVDFSGNHQQAFIANQLLPLGDRTADRFNGMILSGWWRRVGALIIDGIIMNLIIVVTFLLLLSIFEISFNEFSNAFVYIMDADTDADNLTDNQWKTIWILLLTIGLSAIGSILYQCLTMMRKGIRNGQTLGKQALNIAVVRENNQSIGFWFAFLRQVVVINWLFGIPSQILYGIPIIIDYLWPLWDNKHQALHDKIVKTRVVRVDIK
jgi:uncharacterized RDD family membrane protein YckC